MASDSARASVTRLVAEYSGGARNASHLAETLGVVPSSVTRAEHAEADDTITLGTLRRMADALG